MYKRYCKDTKKVCVVIAQTRLFLFSDKIITFFGQDLKQSDQHGSGWNYQRLILNNSVVLFHQPFLLFRDSHIGVIE